MRKTGIIFSLLFMMVQVSSAAELFTVEAGSYDRTATPVYLDVQLPEKAAETSVEISSNGEPVPAQIEKLDNGKARIWWIVSEIKAGESKDYKIEFTEKSGSEEEGFKTLFNGKNLDGWKIQGLEKAGPKILENGVLKVGGWDYWAVITKEQFGDHILKFDFKIEERGNSGILVHTTSMKEAFKKESFEIQLNSNPGKVEKKCTGALFTPKGVFHSPDKNPTKPIGEWNSVTIKYVDHKLTLTINDETVYDNLDMSQFNQVDLKEKGHIVLQRNDYKKAVYFKNIRIKTPNNNDRQSDKSGFHWKDQPKKHMDLLFKDRPVLRYMCTPFNPEKIEQTKKPFHHVFSPDGSQLITKGVGGKYSHHRGIFFGYNKTEVGDKTLDMWHAGGGEHQEHEKVLNEINGPIVGGHTVLINWNDREGKTVIKEKRTLRTFKQPEGQLLIEFESTLETLAGKIQLRGDRQHAGAQFRAAQEVAEHEESTRYLRPKEWSDLPADQQINTEEHQDLPWNAVQFTVGDQRYTVAYLTDPVNPANAYFSERLYGRFGEYFPYELTEDDPLSIRYRWWIQNTDEVSREVIEQRYHDLANPPAIILHMNN